MVIDKSSEKGKKMMERLQERVRKRAEDSKGQGQKQRAKELRARAGAGGSSALMRADSLGAQSDTSMDVADGMGAPEGRKKPMDLSVDTSARPSSSAHKQNTSATEKMLSEVALTSAAAELAASRKTDKEILAKRHSKLDRKAKDSSKRKKIIGRSDSMASVQPAERAAVVARIKKNRGHIDRGK